MFSVIELNESVIPTNVYELTSGVKCIVEDGPFTYIGCDDGGLYGTSFIYDFLVHYRGILN